MKASILDLRHRMREVLKAIDRNEQVTLTYRGHTKATIIPAKKTQKFDLKNHPAFGLWKDRKDLEHVNEAVRRIRKGRVDAF